MDPLSTVWAAIHTSLIGIGLSFFLSRFFINANTWAVSSVPFSIFILGFFKGIQNDPVLHLHDIIEKQIPFGITSVVYQEFLQGVKNIKEYAFLNEYFSCQHFFHPQNPVASYEKAAVIYFLCRKKGITIKSTIDCLIARIAIEHDPLLLHNDKNFTNMASIIDLKLYRV
jgi:predicted nucleic acid-binding protein